MTSAFDIAQRFVGTKETPGLASTPLVLGMIQLDYILPGGDEIPWCSAFVNFVCWLLRLPRSKSLAARSWLDVGRAVPLEQAEAGFDVVILSRDGGGHVGFYAGRQGDDVLLLGGNQGDAVNVRPFPRERVLGVRRLV